MRIVLISCVSKKRDAPARAAELYTSPLFRLNLAYANTLKPDRIFILSAQYGLVGLDATIAPYDKTLNRMRAPEIKGWAERVLGQLRDVADLERDEFVLLAGERYRKHLLPHIKHYSVPLQGKGIGRQLQYLKRLAG